MTIHSLNIRLSPDEIGSEDAVRRAICRELGIDETRQVVYRIEQRSIDARSKMPWYQVTCRVGVDEPLPEVPSPWRLAAKPLRRTVVVVGAGPAGYFAALKLLECGVRPIVLERGKDVVSRRFDISGLLKSGIVHPDSNYCFGEGGAGAYSDGKLYTRSGKRGDVREILRILVAHGASEDILIDTHPHIGSNRLPRIVRAIRQTILDNGGEVRFESTVTGLIHRDDRVSGVIVNDAIDIHADAVILATGHSARDIYRMLETTGVALESKGFAMGVRVEHPQALIDRIRYHHAPRHPRLPAASYILKTQVAGRGVFSFCMCPGGFVVPASTEEGELVLNGMSLSSRSSPYANAGIVVEIRSEDVAEAGYRGPLGGLYYQRDIERTAWKAAGGRLWAPAQRLTDFTAGRSSKGLPKASYLPGTTPSRVDLLLPTPISFRLREAFLAFDKTMRGFHTEDATVLACETRTSSPVRIPRHPDTMMHVHVEGLFPCGEGAGYAGGIVSSAIDGQNVAVRVARLLNP